MGKKIQLVRQTGPNRTNPKMNYEKQLNPGKVMRNIRKKMFKKLPETHAAYKPEFSEISNFSNMGLVRKLNDERSTRNLEKRMAIKAKTNPNFQKPTPIEIVVPEEEEKDKTPWMREYQWDFIAPLVEAHGTNYKAMARDTKRNYLFKTEAALRKMSQQYQESRAYADSKVADYIRAEEEVVESYNLPRPKPITGTVLGAPKQDAKSENATSTDQQTDVTTKTDKKPKANKKTDKTKPATTTDVTKPDTKTDTAKTAKAATKSDVTKATTTTKTDTAANGKPAPAKTGKPAPAKPGNKPALDESDSEVEGMDFDFDENDLSSDDY